MELHDKIYYKRSEYIETDTGNKVSKRSTICGSSNIVLGGKTIIQQGSIIRGDLRRQGAGNAVVVAIGRYCLLGENAVIRPPYKTYKGSFSYYPQKLGDFVTIGANTILEAAQVGSLVEIGKNCIIGRFVVIKDGARIEDDTVVPPGTTIPSLSVYAGSPARLVAELPESAPDTIEARAKAYYAHFVPG
ncbi:uncharacterized protein L969DRAFT_96533 [Mixia osmundae IAM 14324]|uniref:uncharacterized protein n=1 Tax=Mixia osmundae (strain CBS 9802 / IAM 14324 / JCM 22182 / KY 12970) TaxID=764103 RepID=UPI0004A54998|nr:uncharacterized protein L969DRAFT_96533 [Mixia osmundae IAM 14324]KEI37454.1 hypothetical protein L969DRAFT_96533 [Mixia osmundae IAM 14324]